MKNTVLYDQTRVARIVIIRKSKVLLVYSRKNVAWEFPGGKLKSNETYKRGAKRELFEECNIKATHLRLCAVVAHISHSQNVYQEEVRSLKRYFKADRVRGWKGLTFQETEIEKIEWFTFSEALSLTDIHPLTYAVLQELSIKDPKAPQKIIRLNIHSQ